MDWKDSLGALLNSGAIPEAEETESPNTEKENNASTSSAKGVVNVIYERKGRGGKPATILECRDLDDIQTRELAARLKSALGIGGSARDNEILLQGDQRHERLKTILRKEGFRIKGIK